MTTTASDGVDGAVVAGVSMPGGMSIRYDLPAAGLAAHVTGYNVYRAESRKPQVDWFLPAPAMICIAVDAGPIAARIGNRTFDPMPEASMIGPSSRALSVTTQGGTMIGIGISAAGWARLTDRSAMEFHNRIVPAATILGEPATAALVAVLSAAPDHVAIRPLLDTLLPPLFQRNAVDDTLIRRLAELVVVENMVEVGDLAARIDLPPASLRRVSQRYFGMPPKLLLRRARFLRSFLRLFMAGNATDPSAIDQSYHDMPHFLRDANTFLGTTPRRFMQVATPFLEASIRARAAVLGAPTQALHVAPSDTPATK